MGTLNFTPVRAPHPMRRRHRISQANSVNAFNPARKPLRIEVTRKNYLTKIKIPDIINTVKLNNYVNQWVEI